MNGFGISDRCKTFTKRERDYRLHAQGKILSVAIMRRGAPVQRFDFLVFLKNQKNRFYSKTGSAILIKLSDDMERNVRHILDGMRFNPMNFSVCYKNKTNVSRSGKICLGGHLGSRGHYDSTETSCFGKQHLRAFI